MCTGNNLAGVLVWELLHIDGVESLETGGCHLRKPHEARTEPGAIGF